MKLSVARKIVEGTSLPILLQVVLVEGSFPVGAFISNQQAMDMLNRLPLSEDAEVRVTVQDFCVYIGDLNPSRNA